MRRSIRHLRQDRHCWPEAKESSDFAPLDGSQYEAREEFRQERGYKRARHKYEAGEAQTSSAALDALVFYDRPATPEPVHVSRRRAPAQDRVDGIEAVLAWRGAGAPEPNNDHLHIHPPSQLEYGDLNPTRPEYVHGRRHFAPPREGPVTPRREHGLGRGAGRPTGDGLECVDDELVARKGHDFYDQPSAIRVQRGDHSCLDGALRPLAGTPVHAKKVSPHHSGCLAGAGSLVEGGTPHPHGRGHGGSQDSLDHLQAGSMAPSQADAFARKDETIKAKRQGPYRRSSFLSDKPSAVLAVPPPPRPPNSPHGNVASSLRFSSEGLVSQRDDDDGGGRRAGQGRAFKRVALESLQGSAKALDLASRRNPRWGD